MSQITPAQVLALTLMNQLLFGVRQPNRFLKQDRTVLTVDHVVPHTYKQGMLSAQVRQVVTSTYPLAIGGNADNPFDLSDFGLTNVRPDNRVTWVPVPSKLAYADMNNPTGTPDYALAKQRVEQMLAAMPNAGIQRVMSSFPILSDSQAGAINAAVTTLEAVADGLQGTGGQLVRNGNSPENVTKGIAGTPILLNNRRQYRENYFRIDVTAAGSEDIDLRLPAAATVPAAAAPAPQAQSLPASTFDQQAAQTPAAAPVAAPLSSPQVPHGNPAQQPAAQPVAAGATAGEEDGDKLPF